MDKLLLQNIIERSGEEIWQLLRKSLKVVDINTATNTDGRKREGHAGR